MFRASTPYMPSRTCDGGTIKEAHRINKRPTDLDTFPYLVDVKR